MPRLLRDINDLTFWLSVLSGRGRWHFPCNRLFRFIADLTIDKGGRYVLQFAAESGSIDSTNANFVVTAPAIYVRSVLLVSDMPIPIVVLWPITLFAVWISHGQCILVAQSDMFSPDRQWLARGIFGITWLECLSWFPHFHSGWMPSNNRQLRDIGMAPVIHIVLLIGHCLAL